MQESEYMPALCWTWVRRAESLELKPKSKKRADDLCCFMQGAFAALVSTRLMSTERGNQLAFLLMTDRLEPFVLEQASKFNAGATA